MKVFLQFCNDYLHTECIRRSYIIDRYISLFRTVYISVKCFESVSENLG